MAELEPLKELLNLKPADRTYANVRRILFRYNLRIKNSNIPIFDQKNQSGLANFRNLLGGLFAGTNDSQEYLGIVLQSKQGAGSKLLNRIYVEVPGLDSEAEPISPDAVRIDETKNINPIIDSLKQRIFYPVDKTALDLPKPGKIARVRVASNYLNNPTNPHDNKYFGLLDESYTLTADPNAPQANIAQTLNLKKNQATRDRTTLDEKTKSALPKPGEKFILPFAPAIRGELTSPIGIRLGVGSKYHYALDIRAATGADIIAVADATVYHIEENPNTECGKTIILLYFEKGTLTPKYYFKYCHLSKINVKKADQVNAGQTIGKSGGTGIGITGPHIHFEINNMKGERLRPQFILTGTIYPTVELQRDLGYPERIDMPLAGTEDEKAAKSVILPVAPQPPKSIAARFLQPPTSGQNSPATTQSNPISRPKMRLAKLQTDYPKSVRDTRLFGWNEIKVREDVYSDLQQIKDILNNFGISFACSYIDSRLDNKNISLLARVGLQVELNNKAGLQQTSNYHTDDYLIGPDYNQPVSNGYALKVYGRCSQISEVIDGKYQPIFEPIDIYSVKETINIAPPKLIKVQMPVIDITALFSDFGFKQLQPRPGFFKYSDIDVAHWNTFYKPSKITKGYTYRELLETVYDLSRDSIWNTEELVWDGERFV